MFEDDNEERGRMVDEDDDDSCELVCARGGRFEDAVDS